jgi:hypothetical protein
MKAWRTVAGIAAAWMSLAGHAPAMGSGPHPNLPYGLPPPSMQNSMATASFWATPLFWLTLYVAIAAFLVWILRMFRKG